MERVQDEGAQLETLRLAVAAETMALEEVRNQLRTRIRLAATEMLKVAESADCLGTPIARGMPEKPRPQVAPVAPAEITVTSVEHRSVEAPAIEPVLNRQPVVQSQPVAPQQPVVPQQSAVEVAEDKAQAAIESVELPAAAAEITQATDANGPIAGEGFGNPAADAAFERFMSEDIEDEPSREWILAG